MRIIYSDIIGFCKGVEHAIGLAENLFPEKNGPVYALGQLIHNAQECRRFEEKGLRIISGYSPSLERGTLIIRAHGAPMEDIQPFIDAGFDICDAVCPLVKRNLKKISEEKGPAIVLGDCGHAEAKALCSYAKDPVMVCSIEQVDEKLLNRPVSLFLQTTLDQKRYKQALQRIQGHPVTLKNRICPFAVLRRESLIHLAEQCDSVVVIGGKNSANTRALALLAASKGKRVWHIETADEVVPEMCESEVLGIASGSSTPRYIIDKVVSEIREKAGEKPDKIL